MKENLNPAGEGAPARKSVVVILAVLLAGVGALVWYFAHDRSKGDSASTEAEQATVTEPVENTATAPVQNSQPRQTEPGIVAATSSATAGVVPATTAAAQPQVSPYARQIVTALAQLNMTNGPVTQEKLAAWQNTLKQLTNQGPAALPAIREFLASKQDMNFDSVGGSAVLGQPSLRLAMLDAVFAMGGSEAHTLAVDAMRGSTDPREIAIIARNLEQQAPGAFSQQAVEAARAALAQLREGNPGNADVGALFDVLTRYGGADALQDLQDVKGRWTYYSAIALSQLPEGKGIPALIAMAQDGGGNSAYTRSAALQMLAQWSSDSVEARNALLEQTRSGQLGAATWIKIGNILGGEQFFIGSKGETGLAPMPERPVSTYHLTSGNQNFYTVTVPLTAEQINQRLRLIDQLLAGNSNSAANEALQRARTALTARSQPAGQ